MKFLGNKSGVCWEGGEDNLLGRWDVTEERKRQNWEMQTDELTVVNRLGLKMAF